MISPQPPPATVEQQNPHDLPAKAGGNVGQILWHNVRKPTVEAEPSDQNNQGLKMHLRSGQLKSCSGRERKKDIFARFRAQVVGDEKSWDSTNKFPNSIWSRTNSSCNHLLVSTQSAGSSAALTRSQNSWPHLNKH